MDGPGNAPLATIAHLHVRMVHTAFGEKGVSAEQVAGALVKAIRANRASEGALGQRLADQWMVPVAFAVMTRGVEPSRVCACRTHVKSVVFVAASGPTCLVAHRMRKACARLGLNRKRVEFDLTPFRRRQRPHRDGKAEFF